MTPSNSKSKSHRFNRTSLKSKTYSCKNKHSNKKTKKTSFKISKWLSKSNDRTRTLIMNTPIHKRHKILIFSGTN